MKKRNNITLIMAVALGIIGEITNTVQYMMMALFGGLGLLVIINLITYIYLVIYVWRANYRMYNNLMEEMSLMECLEKRKYKAYFEFKGKELEEEIALYDNTLKLEYDYVESCIDFLKTNKKYLPKKKYNNVMEIENKIRKTSKA